MQSPSPTHSIPGPCRSCGGTDVVAIGASVFSTWSECPEVAALRDSSGSLWKCRHCHLIYRDPIPTDDELLRAYTAIPVDSWQVPAPPPYFPIVESAIRSRFPNGGRILDVGCFRGDFLCDRFADWDRFGIEPSPAASAVARSRGIEIVGRSIEDEHSAHVGTFDAAVLMDVFEHLRYPVQSLSVMTTFLKPGGVLVVLTGDADHWLARRSLPFHYYMGYPIHLCFSGRRHLAWAAESIGLRVTQTSAVAHESGTLAQRTKQAIQGLAASRVKSAPHSINGAQSRIGRLLHPAHPPRLQYVKDHVLVVLER